MAEAAIKAAVESYVGSLITLTTKSGMRYEGYLHQVHAHECTIGLKNVKSFGTEGRRGGFVVSPSDKIYDYVVFHGSDIKDVGVISLPSSQSTPSVLDDPAIIETRDSLPPPMHIGAVKEAASSILGTMDTVSRKFAFTPNFNAIIAHTNTINLPHPSGIVEQAEHLLSKPAATTMSRALTMFKKDSDFDAMNEKFNKEEVWGILGKSYKCEDKKQEDGTNLGCSRLSYYEDDDFYDSFSCQDGSARMKLSDQRRKDAETFGFSQTYQQADGQRPHWAGGWKYNNARAN